MYDLQINHLNGNGKLKGSFGHVVAWYRAMLGTAGGAGVGGPPPRWALLVPVREPVSHYLSWYYYFGEPDNRLSVDAWARTGMGTNGAARHEARQPWLASSLRARVAILFARSAGVGVRGVHG